MLLKDAAIAANYPEIATFAMETLLENDPRDVKVLHELGRLYHQYDQSDRAVEVYNRISEIDPLDLDAVKLGKDASARASMKRGGWTEAESYRDLIKDKEVAVSLEQQSRMQLSGESLEQQIDEVFVLHEAEPQNVDLAKRLGLLHDQKDDLEGAIAWYQYAVDLTAEAIPVWCGKWLISRCDSSTDKSGQTSNISPEHGPSDPQFAAMTAQLRPRSGNARKSSIDDARKRLDRNPTDLQLRYELGEHLTNAGRYRDALPELQRARQNPNARLKAMNLLGRCYQRARDARSCRQATG